jgi:hypothetical protein
VEVVLVHQRQAAAQMVVKELAVLILCLDQ